MFNISLTQLLTGVKVAFLFYYFNFYLYLSDVKQIKNRVMDKKELLNYIKDIMVDKNTDVEVNVTINGVDFDMLGYDEDDDVVFLFSNEHDIECDVNESLREGDLLNILEMVK